MRVYICGGLYYLETLKIFHQLDSMKEILTEVVLSSVSRGASGVVKVWADLNQIPISILKTKESFTTEAGRREQEEALRTQDIGLILVFPGGEIIDNFIERMQVNKFPLLVVEDPEWKTKHSIKMTQAETKILEEMLDWRQNDDELVRCRLVSSFKLTPSWVSKFREMPDDLAVYAALKAIRKGNVDAWQELVQVAEDREYLARKGCSPIKAISSRENGKKGGRPKKVAG